MLLLVLSGRLLAQEADLQFRQANELYRTGNYEKAADLYETVLHNGYESPPLYYNLGNSYFKLNKYPSAILNYERARRLAPHDDDIAYNLHLANLRLIDKIEPIPQFFLLDWWKSFESLATSDRWAMIVVMAMWGLSVAAVIFWFVRSALIQRALFLLGLLFILTAGTSAFCMFRQMAAERGDQSAIIFSPSVTVKSSPDDKSTDLFVLHEGIKLELLDNVGEWRKIRLPDGKIGWLPQQDMQVI
jgi:tetratricopeptide (TPR) repeat protein